jgi:hypothetical protein
MHKKMIYLISFVLVLSIVGNASAELVGYWKFDEGSGNAAYDSSGAGNDGAINGATWVEEGKINAALSFDSGDFVEVPHSESLSITKEITVMAWSNSIGISGNPTVVGKGSGAPNVQFELSLQSSGIFWQFKFDDGTWLECIMSTLPTMGEWHHITGTFDGETFKVYLDGELGAELQSSQEALPANDLPVIIGKRINPEGRFFEGMIDEVAIYDQALSADEIQVAMAGGQGEPRPYASGPDPSDGAMVEATWVSVSWRAGDFAVTRDVYISESFDDVNDGAEGAFVGNQATTTLIAGFAGFPIPDGLVPGTTYYWRIDEVNDADPNSPWIGDIWSFTVPPKTAYNPDPADGAGFVDPNAIFTWTPGFGAKLHNVYMGTDFDDVSNATGAMPLGSASYSPGTLESEKVYYWRVDEFDPPFTHKGDVWAFTTPGAVGNPQPANGAVDVQMNATLSWTAADNAASHELYFGADADAVTNATTASPEYAGARALGSESYDPGGLGWDSGYAWRVDEVYATETVKGIVWSLATADYISVDDFEAYNDVDPPDPNSNRIFDKWIDGFGTATNGALVGNDLPPYAEQNIVHDGDQSVIYAYDNAGKTSEATLTLAWPRDWTTEGVTKLSLWFRGDSGNAADRMFVALGSAVVYHDDPAATQISGWNEWVIDLAAFGVNLANVNTVTLGIGTKGSPAAGGAGTMYFDDLRLIR